MFFRVAAQAGTAPLLLKLFVPLLVALFAGCVQSPIQTGSPANAVPAPAAQTPYEQGLASYRDNRFDPALAELNSAILNGDLTSDENINARKHIAFIHCISHRETQCREQFQAILKINSKFDLAPNEAGHPTWGPVWRSVKGVLEEQRAIARGERIFANSGQQKLTEGIKTYDAGRYPESIEALQTAIKSGLLNRADEIRAHKYAAFAYCLTKHRMQCRAEFRAIFTLDPAFQLLPSEAGHPAWRTVYRKERATARRSRAKSLPRN
jgi:tetratricopeptide (TPR) repeat protein